MTAATFKAAMIQMRSGLSPAANIDAEKAARTAERMRKGQFDLTDMREQLLQMANMGGISGLMGMMPGTN